MDQAEEFIEDFLAHYASQFYDPVKAHEYYLKTRELSGRQSTKGLSDKQKEAWSYAKTKIKEAKTNETEKASEDRKVFVEKARDKAQAARKDISEKMSKLFASIGDDRRTDMRKLSEERAAVTRQIAAYRAKKMREIAEKERAALDALPPIPKGITDEQRAKLVAERQKKVDHIRKASDGYRNKVLQDIDARRQEFANKTREKQQNAADKATKAKGLVRDFSDKDREAIKSELKSTIDKAKSNYETLKKNIVAKYEQKSQQEYEAIKAKV